MVGQQRLLLDGRDDCVLVGIAPLEVDERFTLDLLLSQERKYLVGHAFRDVGSVRGRSLIVDAVEGADDGGEVLH